MSTLSGKTDPVVRPITAGDIAEALVKGLRDFQGAPLYGLACGALYALGGVLILEQAFRVLGIEQMVVSDYALREGALLDVLRRRQATSLGHLRDLRYESVLHVASLTPGEIDHGVRVAELAVQLFEGLADQHGVPAEAEQLMREHVYYAGVILRRNYEKLLQAGPDAPGAQPPQRRRGSRVNEHNALE